MPAPGLVGLVDGLLETTIVGSFTRIGYTVRETVEDWIDPAGDLTGQVAVVTGGTSGIGKATAASLLALGAEVHLTSRSQARAEAAAAELNAGERPGHGALPGGAIGHGLDTGSFDSILAFVAALGDLGSGIDILINNAGALTADYRTDDRGTELTLSTHLIGPYLLTTELRPALNPGARVLFVSSGGMYTQRLDVDEIEMSEAGYRGTIAYARAKRGQVELVTHLGPRWAPDVQMHAVHPGWVATPGVDAGLPGFGRVMGPLLRSAEQGADTIVWLAVHGGEAVEPGRFWLDRRPRGTAYLPGTATTIDERERLMGWLDRRIQPATVDS